MRDFDYTSFGLPVADIVRTIQDKLAAETTLIVKAPPGAGKSTLLPLTLLDEPWLKGQKILMLEPRRLAARGIATRMAAMLGESVGDTVGYRVRFDTRVGPNTRIEVLTEGILTRMLHDDNALEGIAMVIFDEFHERSLHADVAMALCREAQLVLRQDLRIVAMSATMDMPMLATMLRASVVESLGRQFPVELRYVGDADVKMLPEMAARIILRAAKENEGDILAFLPGQSEIMQCESLLRNALPDFAICPLFGQLPQNRQNAAIFPNREGKRKVVLATSIAETSLTIEGIRAVVDCGFGRYSQFDPNSGLSRLETKAISIDEADQRAGRAGRLTEGVCYRMWSAHTQSVLELHRKPEIEQADLADLVLDLAQWGIVNPLDLAWLSPPPKGAMAQASEILHELDALEEGKITAHGKQIHRIPCHPRIAHMLVKAHEMKQLALATDLAAVIEERDFMPNGTGIDINLRIEALRRYRSNPSKGKQLAHIERVAGSYRKLYLLKPENSPVDVFLTGVLLAQAYPERIACSRPGNNAQFQLANGKIATAGRHDDLAHEAWLAVSHIDAREGVGKIFLASPLNPRDLAPMLKDRQRIRWDSEDACIVANKELCIGSIVLRSTPIEKPDDNLVQKALCEAIRKEGRSLLDLNEELAAWQARVLSLRLWRTDENWPDVTTENLLNTASVWLSPYLIGVRKGQQLKKLNLAEILQNSLSWEQQQALNKLCPTHLEVPSGSNIALEYRADGSAPILAVRLQEVFGWLESPRVNEGRTAVVMHLLSPGFKPVQITSDLKSFWHNTYFEVKSELRRKYHKHSWPDDPLTAQAIRGAKRRTNP
ncbi:MAG: ATP-dependent helicase HrpB [Bacteroidota bacterium]